MKTEKPANDILVGTLAALVCEVIFGLSYMATKYAVGYASPFALLGWRFILAFVLMTLGLLFGLIRVDLKGKPIKPLLMVAIFSPCTYYIGETMGIIRTTASESGVFMACIPVVSLFASTIFLKKKPSKPQVIGILITLFGVVLTILCDICSRICLCWKSQIDFL